MLRTGALDSELTNKNACLRDNNVVSFPSGHKHVKSALVSCHFSTHDQAAHTTDPKNDIQEGGQQKCALFSLSKGIE